MMKHNAIHIGQATLQNPDIQVEGEFVELEGEKFYKISNYDQMRPFFVGMVSDSDHWLYTSTDGGLTAGRKNPDHTLFPYYTDDKIHDSGELTGSKTIILAEKEGKTYLWEPFSNRYAGIYSIQRNLYKNTVGNRLIFEETNLDLELTFSYGWNFSQNYGFIRKCTLSQDGTDKVDIRILDGMQNLLPNGVEQRMQAEYSTLLDAYKKNELLDASKLGLFMLSSILTDKAEPSESLEATTVWQTGLEVDTYLLSILQVPQFLNGEALVSEVDLRAERGAFLVESNFPLFAKEQKQWYLVAEINQGPSEVFNLDQWLQQEYATVSILEQEIKDNTQGLRNKVAAADGLQLSRSEMQNARHFSNVMFNIMRGGIFDENYLIHKAHLIASIQQSNRAIYKRHQNFFQLLPESFPCKELHLRAEATDDANLTRLCREYLPLTFSRRHGDPSRPWNRFSIELVDEKGDKKLYYQGNWRDIFQNWEALAVSYPQFIESMICKFLSASTPDGYNPYRITSDGIDWEVIEEHDSWSYVGYWGDHQIIYLQKLLELSRKHHPDALISMLTERNFAYANVPYRIKNYADLLADPKVTVDFDHQMEKEVQARVATIGMDGKLVLNQKGEVHLVNLVEKLLVSLLAKLSNFIPEAGIWLNTQRPEWNDANNALVGSGVSMVTLCYIRRFVSFFHNIVDELDQEEIVISKEVAELLGSISGTFHKHEKALSGAIDNQLRRQITDELGLAGEAYRNKVYAGFSEATSPVTVTDLDTFFNRVRAFVDHSIKANQREDKLYHSYNLMKVEKDGGISVRYLYEMLEGQVAVLSSGYLSAYDSLEVLKALRASALYREDQHSYILYPNRQLPRFEVKNQIPPKGIQGSALLSAMVKQNDRRVVEKDDAGQYHFNGIFQNRKKLIAMLESIGAEEYPGLVAKERDYILDLYEEIFDHQSFTGRSGTFFGYEGLGSIYWHMVSKLVLASFENAVEAIEQGMDPELAKELVERYYDIRAGIGNHKGPENYGAFPFEAYSHTPGNAGAQQPGMTGQVKEDILARLGELGLSVKDGLIRFKPNILQANEFLEAETNFAYLAVDGSEQSVTVPANSLAFTYCQVPVVYHLTGGSGIKVYIEGQESPEEISGNTLYEPWSTSILGRTETVRRIEVQVALNSDYQLD